MKASPLHREFSPQSPIDKDNITACSHRESYGWLLSSPLTAIFSRMQLSSSLRTRDLHTDDKMAVPDINFQTIGCQVSSDEFPDDYSVSSYSSFSDSWLMDDLFENSTHLKTHIMSHSSPGSSISQMDDEEHLWRSWESNQDTICTDPLFYPATFDSGQVREHCHPEPSQKFPSQLQYRRAKTSNAHLLQRAPAIRSRSRKNRSPHLPHSTAVKISDSPYSVNETEAIDDRQDYHMKCHSWPASTGPPTRPQRSRANTTPIPASIRKVNRPSNLSLCTPLDQNYSSSNADDTTPRSAPLLPTFLQSPYVPDRDPMDLLVETSAFSDDEDDEPLRLRSAIRYTKSVLNLRRAATHIESETLPVEKAKRKPKMTLRLAVSSLLSRKKGATL